MRDSASGNVASLLQEARIPPKSTPIVDIFRVAAAPWYGAAPPAPVPKGKLLLARSLALSLSRSLALSLFGWLPAPPFSYPPSSLCCSLSHNEATYWSSRGSPSPSPSLPPSLRSI
eukprot:3265556-Rhodomonas_salina.1